MIAYLVFTLEIGEVTYQNCLGTTDGNFTSLLNKRGTLITCGSYDLKKTHQQELVASVAIVASE